MAFSTVSHDQTAGRAPLLELVRLGLFALFIVTLLRHAWVSDDAYITFRTIDNFVHGHGLRWNVSERVQSYTHPLWMMLFTPAYFLTRETFYTAIVFSAVISLAAVWLVAWRHARSAAAGALAVVALGASLGFVDYSTSGLENPLSHLLLGLFFLIYLDGDRSPRTILRLSLIACGVTLNRLDLVLVVAPALAEAVWETRRPRMLVQVLFGFVPLIAWQLFSLVYYGFPFPNTAYAKLGTGHALGDLLHQGVLYFVSTIDRDPVTLWLIAVGLMLPLLTRRRRELAAICGVLLYLAYVLRIGGDFMLGRFLTAPLYVAVMMLARSPSIPSSLAGLIPAALVFFAGVFMQTPTLRADGEYKKELKRSLLDERGVADERAYYHDTNSLLTATRSPPQPTRAEWARQGIAAAKVPHKTVVFWATGMAGFFAGPGKHAIDVYALTDPLLARLPAISAPDWRIGHSIRYLPDGYVESLETGENRIVDPKLAQYYDDLKLVVSGPLFSPARMGAIWRLNLGTRDHLIDHRRYREPRAREVSVKKLTAVDGAPPKPETTGETPSTLLIRLERLVRGETIRLSVEADDTYRVAFLKGEQELGSVTLPEMDGRSGHVNHVLQVPQLARTEGFDGLRVMGLRGRGGYSVGAVELDAK
jgi:arabinofuranosyltransferase